MDHVSRADIEARLDHVRAAPGNGGSVEMIVSRPSEDARRVLSEGRLTVTEGLAGDDWKNRVPPSAGEDTQLALINTRYLDIIAGGRDRWPLAGDQLYVDMDIGVDNMPAGTRLAIGSAVIEITEEPHTGCSKFSGRFGLDALRFVNSDPGKALRLRGVYARVIQEGTIHQGDSVEKM